MDSLNKAIDMHIGRVVKRILIVDEDLSRLVKQSGSSLKLGGLSVSYLRAAEKSADTIRRLNPKNS